MQKNNSSSNKTSSRSVVMRDISRFFIPCITTLRGDNGRAFTLIELLVVVLIIGVLTAIALPQYEKAVWKSRASNLQILANTIGRAHQLYYDQNGTCATSIDSLDVSVNLPQPASGSKIIILAYWYDVLDGRGNDIFEILLSKYENTCLTIAKFKKGKYIGSGFAFVNNSPYGTSLYPYNKHLLCLDAAENRIDKGFCKMYLGTTSSPVSSNYWTNFYDI